MIFDPAGEGSSDPWTCVAAPELRGALSAGNFLRLRRRLQRRCAPEQKNRHNSFDTTLPPSAGDDIHWDATGLAHATQFIEVFDMVAPVRPEDRK